LDLICLEKETAKDNKITRSKSVQHVTCTVFHVSDDQKVQIKANHM